MALIRARFGEGRAKTSRRAFARQISVNQGTYGFWEADGATPTHTTLVQALARLDEVKDPEALAIWAETGTGDVSALFGAEFVNRHLGDIFDLTHPVSVKDVVVDLPAGVVAHTRPPATGLTSRIDLAAVRTPFSGVTTVSAPPLEATDADLARAKLLLESWARDVVIRFERGEATPRDKEVAEAWLRIERAFRDEVQTDASGASARVQALRIRALP